MIFHEYKLGGVLMGQQVNFYLTPKDLEEVMLRVAKCGDFVVLDSRSSSPRPRVLPSVHFEGSCDPLPFLRLTLPEYVDSVTTHAVPEQGCWTIDELRSPIIELNRCFYDGNLLRRGRLYFTDSYYGDDDRKVTKPEPFLRWAKCVLATTRRTLKRDAALGAYVGPDALARMRGPDGLALVSM